MTYEELKQELGARGISQLPGLLMCISRHCAIKSVFNSREDFLSYAGRAYDVGGVGMAEMRVGDDKCSLAAVTAAREAILEELGRRWREDRCSGVKPASDISRFFQPQTNYFCGAGAMQCPICKTGKLNYSRALSNGHVNARCSTEGCVDWME